MFMGQIPKPDITKFPNHLREIRLAWGKSHIQVAGWVIQMETMQDRIWRETEYLKEKNYNKEI